MRFFATLANRHVARLLDNRHSVTNWDGAVIQLAAVGVQINLSGNAEIPHSHEQLWRKGRVMRAPVAKTNTITIAAVEPNCSMPTFILMELGGKKGERQAIIDRTLRDLLQRGFVPKLVTPETAAL